MLCYIFETFSVKNPLIRTYYLKFEWSERIVMIKSECLITTGMVFPVSSDKWEAPFKIG